MVVVGGCCGSWLVLGLIWLGLARSGQARPGQARLETTPFPHPSDLYVALCCCLRLSLALRGPLWLSAVSGSLWLSAIVMAVVVLCGCCSLWLSVFLCASPLQSVALCGPLWPSVAFCASLLLFVASCGIVWLSVAFYYCLWRSVYAPARTYARMHARIDFHLH